MDDELKEYLDQRFATVATKDDLTKMASKDDIKSVLDGIEELARMVATGFEDVQQRLDVTTRMTAVEKDLVRIKEALHLSPSA